MKVTVIKKSDTKVNTGRSACPWIMDAPPVGNEK
jgi:hypothetical protein